MATLSKFVAQGKTNINSNSPILNVGGGSISTLSKISSKRFIKEEEQESYNNGGFFGGLGYFFESIGLGFLRSIEGIWDFTAGGLADLFGADEWAEQQFANDWVNYNDANEWYNPDSTWKVVGDVGMGIGTSLPAIAAAAGSAAAIYFSGGSATGAVAGFWSKYGPALVSSTIAGLGAAGQSTKAAYEKTGELGIKEYGYGALSGVAEAGMEFVSAGIGTGTGRLVKGMTTKAAKKTAETVAKSAGKATSLAITTKAITKGLLKDFAGEAFEEGIQEFIDPMLQRWTQVDPDAENATAQQIAYAALVGGLAGVVMGGAGNITSSIVDSAYYHHKGSQFAKNPELTTSIINQARQTAEYETQHNTGEGVYKKSKDLVEKFDKLDNGTGTLTYGQKRLLGEMAATNSAYILSEPVKRSKQNIIDHAEEFVKAINERGVIDGTTGQPFNFKSADELIKNESLLTQFAVGDALGRLLMSKDSVYDLVMSNGRTDVLMQGDFRNFQKEASPQQKQAVNEFLGIDIDSTTFEDFKRKIETMPRQNMETHQTVMNIRKQSKTEIKKLVNTNADVQEITNRTVFAEGMSVFKTKKGEMFTITKQGNQYYLYADGNVTKPLTKTQLKEIIKQMIGAKKNTNANTGANTQTTTTATQVVNENQNTPRGGVVENSSTERQGKPTTETTTESQDGGKPKKNTKKKKKPTQQAETTTTEENSSNNDGQTENKSEKKKKAVKNMLEAQDNVPANVLGNLIENGTVDYDAISSEEHLTENQSGVEAFAVSESDYVRQGHFSAKSLATAISENAEEINSDYKNNRFSTEIKVKVWDRAFAIEGKELPAWYKKQYHTQETTTNTQKTEKTQKKTSKKAPSKATARKGLLKIVMAKDVRDTIKGVALKDGKQYMSDGHFLAIFNDVMEGLVEVDSKSYPFNVFDNVMKGVRTEDSSLKIEKIDADKLRTLIPTKRSEYYSSIIKIGENYYQSAYISKILDTMESPELYLKKGKNNGVYIKAKNGEAVMLPIRMDGGSPNVVYTANYVEKTTKKTTKKSTKGDVRYAASENAVPNGSNSQQLKPLEMKRAESYAQNNIPGYNNLTQAEKLEVEWTLASGWRVGKDTTEILNLAKLSTAIGAGIGFANLSTTTKDGKIISPDAVCYTRGGHLTIYLNPNGKRTVKSATMHELTHSLEGVDGYSELQSMAEEYYNEHPDEKKAIDDLYRKVYADEQVRYAEEILPAELTAHYVETMLDSRDMLAELTKSEPTFMEKCISKLKAIRDKFKKVKDSDTNEVDLLINKFNFVFNQYKNKSNQTVDATRYATKRGKDGFERDKYFDRQIDKWQELKDGSYIKVGNVVENSAINKVGIPGGTLYFDVSKIKRSMAEHLDHLDSSIIKQIPDLLADPIVITKYDNSTVNVFGEIFVGNSPMMVSVMTTTGRDGKTVINKIRTIHARRNISSTINDNNVLYLNENKKRTNKWFQALDNNVPLGGNSYGFINSIRNNSENVNTSQKKFALPQTDSENNTLSVEQQEYFKDSKIVDKKGHLLAVYHGTFNSFNVFTRGDVGYHFGNKTAARTRVSNKKAAKILKCYLNIKNPITFTKDLGTWDADSYLSKELVEMGIITKEEYTSVIMTDSGKYQRDTRSANSKLRQILISKGYDGIVYKNTYEVAGSKSYIAFNSNQIKLTTNTNPTTSQDVRYALSETVEEEVKKSYGTTYNWRETGYLLKDGTRLDLSGKKQGARGNSRTVDHRDIFDNYDIDGSDAMIEFMGRGNIRVSPEYPGINIQTEPTQEQYRLIQDFVERVGWKEEYFSIDFDDSNGDVIDTLSYEGKMSGRKVVEDIKYFFKEGKVPFKSDLSQFRYALNPEDVRGSNLVTTEMSDERITFKDVFTRKKKVSDFGKQIKNDSGEFTESFRIATTNAQAGIERVLKQTGSSNAEAITNYVRAGKNAGQSALTVGQFSLDGETYMGESWQKIWQPIYTMDKKHPGAYKMFQTYLLHYHNTDRYVVGKPVFGDSITDTDSWAEIKKIEASYPTFKKQAEKVWKFLDNNLQLALDSGLYSKEYVQELRETYPHYVPTLRVEHQSGISTIQGRGNIRVNPNKKKAVGSDTEILPIDNTVAEQTIQRYSSARINEMLRKIANGKPHEEFRIIGGESLSADIDTDTLVTTRQDKNTNQITFWQDGKSVTAEVSTNLYKGVEAFMPSNDNVFNNIIINGVAKINTVFKKLVTAWNPFFVFYKNPMRDMQTALMYSRYSWKTYGKNYARAVEEIRNGGRYWQEAQAAGILSASVYDYRKGLQYKNKGKWANIVGKLESMSNSIEMAPRMAEYISARESGLSVQEALLQAQDLTTNFGRSGTLTKKANATFMPFLNPAVQGFSKLARAYTGKDAAKSWLNLIIRSLILGIGLSALNDLLNEDDEDYQNLSDHIKNSNYVLAIGDGQFLKIPKGRENGFIGELYLRARRSASGETDAWDGTLNSFISNLTPTDNFTRHIFSPLVDLKTNSTWYGGTIESQKWDNTEPKNRYDESTSRISIWLGQVFNYSPIKIDYLFEQYGGIVADIALPATNLEAESGIITQNMLVNSTTNSRWSTQFYSQLEKYNYKKTEGDVYAKGVVKYLNGVNETISKLYKKKREVQQSQTVRNSEKLTQVKVIQATINALQKDSLTNAKILYEELKKYDLSTDEQFEQGYLDSISSVVSAEYALEKYNKKVYEKATNLNMLGVDYETYYNYYFDLKDVTSANGSKKAVVIDYTMAQNLPLTQKLILIMSAGYTINDGDIKGVSKKYAQLQVAKYISKLPITLNERMALAEFCGLTVKDGKIYFKN